MQRPIEPGQYTSLAFGRRLREAGIVGSMGTIGDCYDNAAAESFYATLKTDVYSTYDTGSYHWTGNSRTLKRC